MHTNMGALLALQGNGQDAISHYQEALKIRPGAPETNYNLGNILIEAGKIQRGHPLFPEDPPKQTGLRCGPQQLR